MRATQTQAYRWRWCWRGDCSTPSSPSTCPPSSSSPSSTPPTSSRVGRHKLSGLISYSSDFFFEAVVTVNLTSLLVLTTLFISVSGALPQTAYVKMVVFVFCIRICICNSLIVKLSGGYLADLCTNCSLDWGELCFYFDVWILGNQT